MLVSNSSQEIQQRTKLPVKFVVNTHYHLDHVAGNNERVCKAGRHGARAAQRSRVDSHREPPTIGDFLTPELKALTESIAAPSVDYEQASHLYLGSRAIHLRSFPGHTGGDSIVIVPDARVAFLGDLFWCNMLPTLIDASTKPWVETLDAITGMNEPGYTFVPGHGAIGAAKDVAAFRDYLTTLRTLVSEARTQGNAGDALVQSIVPRLKEKFGQWEFAEPVAKNNILETDAERNNTKPVPQPLDGETRRV